MADHVDPIEWSRHRWERGNGPAPEHFAAMATVLRLEQLMGATLDRSLREYGLNRTGYLLLATLFLATDRTLPMGQLSRRLLLHPTTVSLVTDKLQVRELVTRTPHPTDRRTILASLTKEGARYLSTVSESLSELNYGLTGVDTRMAITLTEIVRQVRGRMGDG